MLPRGFIQISCKSGFAYFHPDNVAALVPVNDANTELVLAFEGTCELLRIVVKATPASILGKIEEYDREWGE